MNVYRVVAVTDETNSPWRADFVKSVSAPSYCHEKTKIYLSCDGLENPNCSAILIITEWSDPKIARYIDTYDVRFIYDDGEYTGTLRLLSGQWQGRSFVQDDPIIADTFGEPIYGVIFNISSL